MKFQNLTIKQKVNLIIIAFFILSAVSMGVIVYSFEMKQLEDRLSDFAQNQSTLFANNQSSDVVTLAGVHIGLAHADSLLRPFAARNKTELMAAATPIFATLRQNCKITHMYFITPDGRVLLRVHKPEQAGDKLERETFRRAAATNNIASGIELGLNFFSLRSVSPVSFNGKMIGYIEVAEEIGHIFERMKKDSGNDSAVLLNAEYLLSQPTSVSGKLVGNFAILYPSDRNITEKLVSRLLTTIQQQSGFKVSIENSNGKKFAVGLSPLHDASGTNIGFLISHKEITSVYSTMWQGIASTILIYSVILFLANLVLFSSTKKSVDLFCVLHSHILEIIRTWHLSERINVTTGDEIGVLASAFNTMLAELESQRKELKHRLDFQQIVTETIPIPIFYKNLHGHYLGCNSSFAHILGMEKEQIIGKSALDVASPALVEAYGKKDQELYAERGVQIYDSTVVSRDGVVHDVTFYKAPFYDAEGELSGLVGAIIEITEQKRLIRTLSESETRFRTLFDNVVDAIYIHDFDGKIVEVNEIACSRLGYSKDEFKRMNLKDIVVPDDVTLLPLHFQKASMEGLYNLKGAERCKDGTILQVEVSSKSLTSGDTTLLIGITRDMTESIRLENERQQLENQLQHSQKMEAIGQLAGGVAHDFNNKLMVIMGAASLAKMEINNRSKVLKYLQEINCAAEHSRDITQRLLAFSRKQVISPQHLNANDSIAETIPPLSRLIGENILITFLPDENLWTNRIDPAQLDQIVMNLAINARDAMPDGGTLRIETRNVTLDNCGHRPIAHFAAGDYVEITFADSGVGMDSETLAHIFEPFFTTKDVGKGTGLGLSTVYGIISQNNGFIDVTSTPGSGTNFKVYIPRYDEPTKEIAKTNDTVYAGNSSILLVEDEHPVRSVTSNFLNKIGYTVYEAATPCAALELVRDLSIKIDLVLTDYVMPEMNGWIMMEKVREIRPDIKCIYASGYSADNVLLCEASDSGSNFIQKPYDFIKLSKLLNRELP